MSNSLRDRTNEFFSIVQTAKALAPIPRPSANFASNSAGSAKPLTALQQQSEFTRAAASISKGIFQVTDKLEHLAKLAKQKSLFNDQSDSINELASRIKGEIQLLSKDIEALEFHVSSQRGNPKEFSTRDAAEHGEAVVKQLKSQLADTTKNFTGVLTLRSQNLKDGNSRRKHFENPTGKHLKKRTVDFMSRISLQPDDLPMPAGGNRLPNAELLSLEPTSFDRKDAGQQMQLLVDPVESQEDVYYESRANALAEIEKTIVELGEMYKRLIQIVHAHEDLTIRIDANIETALDNIARGQEELETNLKSQQDTKWLIVKIFAVLLFFMILWAVIR